ncbi:MAG: RNA polymerase subunit sigma-70 [Dysgonamonadaceae bacterium]|jgi:hypothetical protein|nr:RNA polymerase subunit sigma-70 [Dysgonamonadaceae bacterium]
MKKATISADIVSSTSLDKVQRMELEEELRKMIEILEKNFSKKSFFGRIIKGDYIECVVRPKHALRVALLIKSFVKSLNFTQKEKKQDFLKFKEYGVRIAVGLGNLEIFDTGKGIIDGEAIYLSGRAINEMSKNNKCTLVFRSKNEKLNKNFTSIFNLLDFMFNKYKEAQSKIVFYKLLNKTDREIASLLGKSISTINQHSTSTGWHAVENAVTYFEKSII